MRLAILPLFTILILDLGIVPTVRYVCAGFCCCYRNKMTITINSQVLSEVLSTGLMITLGKHVVEIIIKYINNNVVS
jgi:hypothetical protein